ncbi:MAG: hypothetical protein HYT87_10425 [Nitrospirae bacterium]|nr:hypothetical protein [Nitrospirota bacterium]
MAKKGNGMDLANDYLRQIVGKLDGMEKGLASVREGLDTVREGLDGVRQEQIAMRREQEAMRLEMAGMSTELKQHGVRLDHIEEAVRRIAAVAGQEFQDLKRRVEVLERKPA